MSSSLTFPLYHQALVTHYHILSTVPTIIHEIGQEEAATSSLSLKSHMKMTPFVLLHTSHKTPKLSLYALIKVSH